MFLRKFFTETAFWDFSSPNLYFFQNRFIYKSYRIMVNLSSEGCSFLGSKRSFISCEFESWPRSSVSMRFSDYNRCEKEKVQCFSKRWVFELFIYTKPFAAKPHFVSVFPECLLYAKRKGQLLESFCLLQSASCYWSCLLQDSKITVESDLRCMNILRNGFSENRFHNYICF